MYFEIKTDQEWLKNQDHSLLFGQAVHIEFVCSYSLGKQSLSSVSSVQNGEISLTRQAKGYFEYRFEAESTEVQIGQRQRFSIIPSTPNVIFASIVACRVENMDRSKSYDLIYEKEEILCTDWLTDFKLDESSEWSSSHTQQFR